MSKTETEGRVPVGPGTRVGLAFSLKLDTGELIDSTEDRVVEFEVGDGSLLPGFESALFGLFAGDGGDFDIDAENGFGLPNDENVHMMKRTDFDRSIGLEPGLVVSFADADRGELPGVVKRLLGDLVEVDFNHPLSGRNLVFSAQIHRVEQVSNEIARG